jgi:hypothetical protein
MDEMGCRGEYATRLSFAPVRAAVTEWRADWHFAHQEGPVSRRSVVVIVLAAAASATPAAAQAPAVRPTDVQSPEAVVRALYETVSQERPRPPVPIAVATRGLPADSSIGVSRFSLASRLACHTSASLSCGSAAVSTARRSASSRQC